MKTNDMSREEVLAAVRAIPAEEDLLWNGVDEDDRPASEDECRAGVEAYPRRIVAHAVASHGHLDDTKDAGT